MNSKSNSQTSNELCFIDKFLVPKNSIEEFTQRMNYNRNFIKNLPGFIEDKVYEQRDEEGNLNIITIAVWASQDHVDEAKNAVQSEYKRIEFNMPAFIERLKIKHERGLYHQVQQ
jgi:heme-degrading monooxygenase HmoA